MEILLQDLVPGQEYLIQLRSKSQDGTSQWSRAYSITTDSDITAPSPATGLTWVLSGTSFVGEWTAPTTDSDGGPLKDFKDFKVTLTASATNVIFYVTEPRFDLSLSRNISAWGSPKPSVDIKVETRDNLGNLSSPVTASATNPIPADVTNFDSTSALGGVNLTWDHIADNDLKQYEIYVGGSSGFTPGPGNLKVVTTSNAVFYATSILTLQYFKIRAVDAFDQGSANYILESQLAYPLDGVPDSTAPSQPSAPTVSTATLVAQVSHAMTKQAGGNLESDVDYLEIHASTSTGFTPDSTTLRGTIDSAGQGIAVSAAFYFPTTDSMTNLYWKVIAVDRSRNKSSASNQTTGLPNLIENANILNATITDAKVQNLSAAKLIAGTAIVNDLFIESNLTVSAAGTIESDNFSTGVSGWKIAADGSVEFNDGLFRGDIELSTVYETKDFTVEIGNMDSYFVWSDGETIDGQEPTLLFRGWSFKPDGIGNFDPIREIQSVVRLTPLGELQFIFDPSHSSDILSVDGNNRRDALGDTLERYYGWVDKRMGLGTENDTSYDSDIQGRDEFSNTFYYDEYATARSTTAMGSEAEVNSRTQGNVQADGSLHLYQPESLVKISSDSVDDYVSKNIIQDGMDLFDNGGGVGYYNTNTTRNRITLNSILTNLRFNNSSSNKLRNGIDATITSAGAGNPSIAFASSSTTYPISVTPGDEYFMAFQGYKPSGFTVSYRFFMKTNNGVTTYGPTVNFNSGSTNTLLTNNTNRNINTNDFLVVPSGVTSAHFGIEFVGTVASNQNLRISGVQLIKAFAVVSGSRQLVSNFYYDRFVAVGESFGASGQAEINLSTWSTPGGYIGTDNPKFHRHSYIDFEVSENDSTSGSLGFETSSMTLYATGLKVGSYGEARLPHGEMRYLQSTVVNQFAAPKLLFNNTRTLDKYDAATMSTSWIDMGVAIDNTPGYTTFVPQRAGLFLICVYLNWNADVTLAGEYHVVELIKDSTSAFLGVHKFTEGQARGTGTFVVPLSVGEKVFLQVFHEGAVTRTYDTTSNVSFVQLI